MKIFVCQTAPQVGAIKENSQIIQQDYNKSQQEKANICVFPELCITGYLAEDLFLKKDFIDKATVYAEKIIKNTKETYLILPTILYENNHLYNVAIIAQKGQVIDITYKIIEIAIKI